MTVSPADQEPRFARLVTSRFDGLRRWLVPGLLAVLMTQFIFLGLIQAWTDSFTFDEPFYAASGSTMLRERDMRINFEHPPLPKALAAIPAEIAGGVEVPLDTGAWENGDTWNLSLEMYQANLGDIQRVTFLFRIVPTLLAAGVGALLFLFARELFGWRSGLLAAALWLTAPIAVGYGHLNGLDVPAAFTVILALLLVARYGNRPTIFRLSMVAVGVGAALLTRAAVGLVVAVAAVVSVLVMGLLRRDWWVPAKAAAVGVVGWGVVWLGYALLDPAGLSLEPAGLAVEAASLPARLALLVPWPDRYEQGILFLSDFHQNGESSGYLFGSGFTGAPNGFWFGSFLFKMTLGSLVAIVGGMIVWGRIGSTRAVRALIVVGPPLIGLVAMMSFAERPFGARYLIPIIAILFVVASPLTYIARNRWTQGAVVAIIALQVFALWSSHPGTFSWSNPLYRDSWQQAADSNVDWGQDFYRLQDWAAEHDEAVWVSYFGFGPSFDLSEIPNAVSAHPNNVWGSFKPPPAGIKTYAISASNLNAFVAGPLSALRSYCPVELIGSTIVVYRFDEPPSLLNGDNSAGIPEGLCEDRPISEKRL